MTPCVLRGAACGIATLFVACAIGPNHKQADIRTPEGYRADYPGAVPPSADAAVPVTGDAGVPAQPEPAAAQAGSSSIADLPWWEVYRDPTLSALIKEATGSAYDVRIAMARVEMARQAHVAAAWALAPTIGLWGGAGAGVGTATVPSVYPPISLDGRFGAGVAASWEPDVWGRLRRSKEVQKFNFEAATEDWRGVQIALVGDVAESYFRLLSLDLQKRYATKAVATRGETATFFEQRARGGVSNNLEVLRAQAALREAEAAVTRVELDIANSENMLSFLLARAPGSINRTAGPEVLASPPAVPSGLPSSLLKRRPDIRAADRRLGAANAQIGVAKAEFFPAFELTGFLGVASENLQQASFTRGGSGLFSWTLPVLGGHRVQAEYKAAKAAWEGATAEYERVAVNSFREVADALAAIQVLGRRRAALDGQLNAIGSAESVALERYRGGVANYLDVLTTQEQLLVTELELANVMGLQQIAVARLYRTLGGGWSTPEKPVASNDSQTSGN